ncbi:MAG: hypothetical protein EB053_01085 [Chlamydiae bacterium]|nr:hypothetical protein [Chlamydiota bacterium]
MKFLLKFQNLFFRFLRKKITTPIFSQKKHRDKKIFTSAPLFLKKEYRDFLKSYPLFKVSIKKGW